MANEIQTNTAEVQQAVDAALKEQKKKKKKKKLIIFAVIAVIIVLIIALASSGGSSEENNVNSLPSSSSDNSEISNNQPIETGNAITTKYLKLSYISCNTNYKNYESYLGPQSGNKVVRAEFSIENISSSDQIISGFECYADNQKCEAFFGASDSTLSFDSISSGRTITMILYFEVPENAKDIELEFEENMWSNEKIKFVIK